ncbi:hypothetical protein [Streptomyces lasiicapitis]|uniref:Sel1 repeat family protein n=1 Tax=Streptomyces lasiicapitis TaxID=1923961 RepID=A0ABQ2M1I7_9ACTN|nr:hypothetical protein [Streptomyces lasiicapitis]GGO45746.1 hypothetical protein GCM10012286_34970 [Streptomyces lasiicapitis]
MDEAVELYERSAASGYTKALYAAAEYLAGEGRQAEAVEVFRRLAERGHGRARRRVDELLHDARDGSG